MIDIKSKSFLTTVLFTVSTVSCEDKSIGKCF